MSSDVPSELVDALCEFLEAAVHAVLAARGLYSNELFERHRIYSIFVQKARHPELCAYISSVLTNLKPLLAQDTLQELDVVFFDSSGAPVEKVAFVLQALGARASRQQQQQQQQQEQHPVDVDLPALEAAFSSVLTQLPFIDNALKPLPAGASFELLALARSRHGVDARFFAEEEPSEVQLQQPVSGTALRTLRAPGALSMQVLLEESCHSKP